MGGEHNHFPEPIIQHIQSFLTPKEAARTAILSKSWGGAWLTRPNLEFDRSDFQCRPRQFGQFADETLKRYEDSNLKIESFRIRTETWGGAWLTRPNLEFIRSHFPRRWGRRYEPDLFSEFANKTLKRYEDSNRKIESFTISAEEFDPELIARALKIGATRLNIKSRNSHKELPCEVVFGSENLASITVEGCAISLRKGTVFRCSALRFLCLDSVFVRSTGTITRILSSCPLIERLSLSNIDESPDDNNGNYHDYDDDDDDDDDGVLNGLHRLRSLVLKSVYFDKLFLCDISTRFPSLKDLTVEFSSCIGAYPDMLLISSSSIERLYITIGEKGPSPWIKFVVPNIHKFSSTTAPSFR